MIDEGYIKFNLTWDEKPEAVVKAENPILSYRDRMFDLNLIGHDTRHNVGYGNISQLQDDGSFVISGTQTGHHKKCMPEHFSKVTSYHVASNRVACTGPVKASSESLTHAAIYELDKSIKAVIHVHHKGLWERFMDLLPTTKKEVPYGTPEMAKEIFRLWRLPDLPEQKILIMAGHEDGVICFDTNFEACAERLEYYLENV